MADTYVYNAEAQLTDGQAVLLDLERHGWADKDMLAKTVRWTLLPKDGAKTMRGTDYPFVVVNIPRGAKAVFRSRFVGMAAVDPLDELPDLAADRARGLECRGCEAGVNAPPCQPDGTHVPYGRRYPLGCKVLVGDNTYQNQGEEWVEIPFPRFRLYGIGYKLGTRTFLTWVLPTGDVEHSVIWTETVAGKRVVHGDDVWLSDLLLTKLRNG